MPQVRNGVLLTRVMSKQSSSKFRNRKTEVDGIRFDSKHEAERWSELKILEKANQIRDLQRQVPFELIPAQKENGRVVERAVKYYADFVYFDHDGNLVVEDAKSPITKTDVYKLKRKMMKAFKGIEIKEV